MEKSKIILLIAVIAFAAFKIYQRYFMKGKNKSGTDDQSQKGSQFTSSSKDDEYEPYSKK
jgi:uncharacterized membrane protein YebE (DUF533 family)